MQVRTEYWSLTISKSVQCLSLSNVPLKRNMLPWIGRVGKANVTVCCSMHILKVEYIDRSTQVSLETAWFSFYLVDKHGMTDRLDRSKATCSFNLFLKITGL